MVTDASRRKQLVHLHHYGNQNSIITCITTFMTTKHYLPLYLHGNQRILQPFIPIWKPKHPSNLHHYANQNINCHLHGNLAIILICVNLTCIAVIIKKIICTCITMVMRVSHSPASPWHPHPYGNQSILLTCISMATNESSIIMVKKQKTKNKKNPYLLRYQPVCPRQSYHLPPQYFLI